ncbi:MAG TPA: hypothetical protein VH573_18975 [Mycobacteriales bacterium]
MTAVGRRRWAARLGVAGGALGIAAGAVQATVGARIPEWTAAKQSPVALGLLTVGLSALAVLAAARQRDPALSVRARAACALGLAGPALLCLSTVGRLWYLPCVLLLAAAACAVDGWRRTAEAVARDWTRILLSALGGFEILMAAGAAPAVLAVGVAGGLCLIAAAWLRPARRWVLPVLLVAGTVPFAALAWTALVPVLLAVAAAALAVPVLRARVGEHPVPVG